MSSENLIIIPLNQSHDAVYAAFLDQLSKSSPSVLGYHYPLYRDMLAATGIAKPLFFGAWQGDSLVGAIPGFMKEGTAGLVYCSLPFFGPNGGVLCASGASEADIHRELLGGAHAYLAKQPNMLSAAWYTPFLRTDLQPYDQLLPRAITVEKFTQYLTLATHQLDSKLKYDLRRAEKLGVTVSRDVTPERINRFYEIYMENCRDHNIPPKPRAAVDFLFQRGLKTNQVTATFAVHEGKVVGGLMMIWSPGVASYYIPCSAADARTLQPNTVLIVDALEEAKRRGVRYWNWESSPTRESGVFAFKKKWGSEEGQYRVYIQPFQDAAVFKSLGREQLAKQYPFFFVYPFDKL